MTLHPVPPNAAESALDLVRSGGTLYVRTSTRIIRINRKVLESFERAGVVLLKAEGDGYRLRNGKGSVFLLPGQLEYVAS